MQTWTNLRYDIVHWVLAVIYFLLFLISLGVVGRLIRKNHWNLRWQKVFHPLFWGGCLIRSVFFLLAPFIMENTVVLDNKVNVVLNTLPTYFFFSDYLIILFLWAEIYHYAQEKEAPTIQRLQPIFFGVNIVMYVILGILYALDWILNRDHEYFPIAMAANTEQRIIWIFGVAIYTFTSVGFLVYGARIYYKFSRLPTYSPKRQRVLRKIQIITVLVSLCFIIRVVIIILGSVIWSWSEYWWLDGAYFFLLEVVPLLMMLQLLHGEDPKKPRIADGETAGLLNS
jgi:hypothetical protein